MVVSFMHFLHEQRFNRDLLYDLIATLRGRSYGHRARGLMITGRCHGDTEDTENSLLKASDA